METEPDLEQQIDEMCDRFDSNYFHIMDKEVQYVRDIARMNEIQAELGRLSAILREVYPQWDKLVHERIEVSKRLY